MKNEQTDPFSKNGMQTRVWGPAGWVFLHCIAQNYPEEPTQEQKENYLAFFYLVGNVLPCRYCRESYQEFIKQPGTQLNEAVMKNRKTFTHWLYLVHNKINNKLGVSCSPTFSQVTDKYESFRSKCTKSLPKVVKKGCTEPASGYRKRCKVVIEDVDANGNPLKSSFGKENKRNIKLISIKKSDRADKKLMATFETNGRRKVIHFGQKSASDFTKHKDQNRKSRYVFRHHKDLGTGNPARAGYLSMYVLWNKPTLAAGISDYRRRLNIYNKTGKFPTNIDKYKSPGKKKKYQ